MIGIMGGMFGPVLLPAPEGRDPALPAPAPVLGASDEVGTEPDACPEPEATPWAPWVFAAP